MYKDAAISGGERRLCIFKSLRGLSFRGFRLLWLLLPAPVQIRDAQHWPECPHAPFMANVVLFDLLVLFLFIPCLQILYSDQLLRPLQGSRGQWAHLSRKPQGDSLTVRQLHNPWLSKATFTPSRSHHPPKESTNDRGVLEQSWTPVPSNFTFSHHPRSNQSCCICCFCKTVIGSQAAANNGTTDIVLNGVSLRSEKQVEDLTTQLSKWVCCVAVSQCF